MFIRPGEREDLSCKQWSKNRSRMKRPCANAYTLITIRSKAENVVNTPLTLSPTRNFRVRDCPTDAVSHHAVSTAVLGKTVSPLGRRQEGQCACEAVTQETRLARGCMHGSLTAFGGARSLSCHVALEGCEVCTSSPFNV